ncbi:MAG: hypothetical protein LH472_05665 [Pyrinomonadaceae bacterium]|nr:hypothetical protein [Pyrinomonadaceae bacterium]
MRFKFLVLVALLVLTNFSLASAQEINQQTIVKPTPEATPKAAKKDKKSDTKQSANGLSKNATAEQVAESVVFIYGGLGGRDYLKQIRKTTIERGKINILNADGKTEQATYERLIVRGDNLEKERVRFDQSFPSAKYALVYNNDKIFGVFNDAVFTPREDATKAFENQIWRGLEALLRYKENGSTLALGEREKLMNVEFFVLDVTDKQNRKTRFYISSKTLRVMMLEYEEAGVKLRRKFYDYNYAQGTLVPFRSVLWANDKQIEETNIQTISFGQKVEEDVFKES